MTEVQIKITGFFLTVLLLGVENDTVIFGLEPLHVADVHAWPAQHDVKVHTVNTDVGVVLDTQVNVFLDTEAEVTVVGKVLAAKLELAHLQSTLKNFFGLGPSDSAVNGWSYLIP